LKRNFITQFFDKNPDELIISDIQNYFNERQEESSTLEFKSGDAEINDVFKEVAAFLNTEGGLLIIGSPRETRETLGKRVINFCKGEVTYSKFASKDWLHQKIFSNITPSPTEIYIKEIVTEKGNIFILDIPQSSNPPHQSNADGRYYIRLENEAKPAPHGLIQALFDKRKKPKLFARVNRVQINQSTDTLFVSLHNDSNVPADKVSFIIDIYNIEKTDNKLIFKEIKEDELGRKLSFSERAHQVLVSVISLGVDFQITHFTENYLVAVNYWSKDTDFDCMYFVIDPINNSITSNHWLDENSSLIQELKKLKA